MLPNEERAFRWKRYQRQKIYGVGSDSPVLRSARPLSSDCYCRSHRKSYMKYYAYAYVTVWNIAGGVLKV